MIPDARWRFIALHFRAGDGVVVNFIGTIRKAQNPLRCVHEQQWRPLRNPGRAVNPHCVINDFHGLLRHHRLDRADPYPHLLAAQNVHRPDRFQHHQTHRLNLDPPAAERFHVLAQIDGQFGRSDQAHAMVDASLSKAQLADFEAPGPSPSSMFASGTRTLVNRMCM